MNNFDSQMQVNRSLESNRGGLMNEPRSNILSMQARNIGVRELLHQADPHSSLFIQETDRFGPDFATYEHRRRLEQDYKRKLQLERHRLNLLERDSKKLTLIEEEEKRANARQNFKQEVLSTGKKNKSGLPYNVITLEYENSPEGNQLRQKDELSQVRAYLRAHNIDSRSNCGYNLLSGVGRRMMEVPQDIQNKYSQEIQRGLYKMSVKNFYNQ